MKEIYLVFGYETFEQLLFSSLSDFLTEIFGFGVLGMMLGYPGERSGSLLRG